MFLAILLGAALLPAEPLILTVNDPRSHGAIDDTKLSLDEAVMLINQDNLSRATYLSTWGFSQAERGQMATNPAGAIPASPALVGRELFAQPIAVPQSPRAWQSPLTLPAGGRFVIQ